MGLGKSTENHRPAFRKVSSKDNLLCTCSRCRREKYSYFEDRNQTAATRREQHDYYGHRNTQIERTEDADDGKCPKESHINQLAEYITKLKAIEEKYSYFEERNHTAATRREQHDYYGHRNTQIESTEDADDGKYPAADYIAKAIEEEILTAATRHVQHGNYDRKKTIQSTEDADDGKYPKDCLLDPWVPYIPTLTPMEEYRIMIVGACGTGKSSLANTILGKHVFKTGISAFCVTRSSQEGNDQRFGRSITVVDTVGYNSKLFTKSSLLEAFEKESPGPHAVLLTMSSSERFTTESFSAIDQFANLVGKDVYNFTVIVLTHADELTENSITLDQFRKNAPHRFQKLVKCCGDRLIEIDNTATEHKKRETVERLLYIIDFNRIRNNCFDTYNKFLF